MSLYVNKNSPGFTDVEEEKGVFSGTIDEGAGTVTFNLPAYKFNNCESVSIFVGENHGGDITSLHKLNFEGTSVMNTDVSKIHESK